MVYFNIQSYPNTCINVGGLSRTRTITVNAVKTDMEKKIFSRTLTYDTIAFPNDLVEAMTAHLILSTPFFQILSKDICGCVAVAMNLGLPGSL